MTMATTDRPARTDMGREEAEEITESIKNNFDSLGKMLIEVRDRKGYRALGYTSLEGYCLAEFGKGRSRVYQLMEEAEIEKGIITELAAANSDIKSLKMPGSYLRELGSLQSPQEQIEAIAYANKLAENEGKPKATKIHLQVAIHKLNHQKPEQTKEIIKTIGFDKGVEVEVLEGQARGQRGVIRKIDKKGVHVELYAGNSIPITWDISDLRIVTASERPKKPTTIDTINIGDTVRIFSSNNNKGKVARIVARVNDKLALVEVTEGYKSEIPYAELEQIDTTIEDNFQLPANDSIWAGSWNKFSSWYYNTKNHQIHSFGFSDLVLQPPAKCPSPSDWLENWRQKNAISLAEELFTQDDLVALVAKTTSKMTVEEKQAFSAKINIHVSDELSELRTRLAEAETTIQAMVNAASTSGTMGFPKIFNFTELPVINSELPVINSELPVINSELPPEVSDLEDWKSILTSNNFTPNYHYTDDSTEEYRGWKIYLDPNGGFQYIDLNHPEKGAFCCDTQWLDTKLDNENEDAIIAWAKTIINQIEDFCPGQLIFDFSKKNVHSELPPDENTTTITPDLIEAEGCFPTEVITQIELFKTQKQITIERIEHQLKTESHTIKREKKLRSSLRGLKESLQNLEDVQKLRIGQIVRHKSRPEITGRIAAFTLSQGGMPEVWVQWPNQTDEISDTGYSPEKVQLLLAED